jgi:putative transposase
MTIQHMMFTQGMDINYQGEDVNIASISQQFSVLDHGDGVFSYPHPKTLLSAYKKGKLIIKKREESIVFQPLTKEEDKKKAEWMEAYLVELHQEANPKSLVTRQKITRRIAKRRGDNEENTPSSSTLYRWYNAWIENELDIVPLVIKPVQQRAKQFAEETIALAEAVIDEVYLKRNGPSVLSAFNEFTSRFHELNLEGKCISRSRFYEMIDGINKLDRVRARDGNDAARKFARASNGKYVLDFPLQRVEIDAVHLKVGLLDDVTGEFIGVPILYLAIDVFSRCIVGYSISYGQSPSETTEAVIELLKHCVAPKTKARKAVNEWPLTGAMFAIYGDAGGAFKSKEVTAFLAQIKCHHVTTETKSPWRKGFIESFNKTVRTQMCSTLPGYMRNNGSNTYEKSLEAMATLTLDDFINVLEQFILDHYHQNSHRGLDNDTPANVCEKALEDYCPRIVHDLSKLEIYGGADTSGVIQASKGIQRNNVFYMSNQLRDLYIDLAKSNKRKNPKVDFLYNPKDISKISVIDENKGTMFLVPCIDPRVSAGMSLRELKAMFSGKKCTEKNLSFIGNTVVSEAIKVKAATEKEKADAAREAKKIKQAAEALKASEAKNQTNATSGLDLSPNKHIKDGASRLGQNHTTKKVETKVHQHAPTTVTKPVVG